MSCFWFLVVCCAWMVDHALIIAAYRAYDVRLVEMMARVARAKS